MSDPLHPPRPFSWDGAINIPTIIAGMGVVIAFASGLAVAQERINKLEHDVGTMPERVAAIEATLKSQNDLLRTMDAKIDNLQATQHRDDPR